MERSLQERALYRAAGILGGLDALAQRLQVHPALLLMWMKGEPELPGDVFLKVVEILLERDLEAIVHRPIQ